MAVLKKIEEGKLHPRKPVAWLHGEIKTPPFSEEGRREAGEILRLLQEGENLTMPFVEPLPVLGPRCGVIRVRDEGHNWRIVYRVDPDAILIFEVYAKKTRTIPQDVIERSKKRLKDYDGIAKQVLAKSEKKAGQKGM